MLGDAGRLRQVLLNLVGNAIKFSSGQTRPGMVSMRALRVATDGADDTLELVVADNGVGMDAQTVARLFSPFTQADASTTRRFGGTGLGLSISQRLVSMMGGQITVRSDVDQGSTFTVRLPMALPAAADAVPVPAEVQGLQGLQCLLIGAPDITSDLADYLTHAGCMAHCAPTLVEGLSWLHAAGPGRHGVVVAGPPEGIDQAVTACRAVALQRPEFELALVVVQAGRRHRPRRHKPDLVCLDGDCLHRAAFLRGVALAVGLSPAAPHADVPTQVAAGASARESGRRSAEPVILVAEDNEVNQQVLSRQLALLGYRSEIASDGVEALAHWRRGGHALLLTDLHMPAMDGYTLAAAVRAEEGSRPRLPIIALTANALRDEEHRCREAGMDGYLTKPVRLAQLKAAIDAWLRPTSPRADGSVTHAVPEAASQLAPPPADLDVLAELIGDDPQVLQEVLAAFRANTARSALELTRAHADGAVQSVADIAHKLKSAARTIGAARLGQICAEIEASAASSPRSGAVGALMAAFDNELQAVHHFLDVRQDHA
jgi:CheY-like chemotaxis protein/HPt (histidine-containing phosphotransfer) domain-containing protein